MNISYKKLWKLLIDKDMTKMELREAIGISTATLARMSKDESVSMDVLKRICSALKCDIGDIMEMTNNNSVEVDVIKQRV